MQEEQDEKHIVEKINYRTIFKKKIVLYSIGTFNIPSGIELKKIIIGVISFGVAFLLKFLLLDQLIPFYNSFSVTIYYVLVVLLSCSFFGNDFNWLEGKTPYRFITDYVKFMIEVKLPKKKFSKDKVADSLNEKVKIIIK